MIEHIVMWRLHEHAAGADRATNAQRLKTALEALPAVIPQIYYFQVGIDELCDPQFSAHVVLISRFASWADLDIYQKHPAHVQVAEFIKEIRVERRVVDFTSP